MTKKRLAPECDCHEQPCKDDPRTCIRLSGSSSHLSHSSSDLFDLKRAGDKDWFSHFYRCYRRLWEESKYYVKVHDDAIEVDAKLDSEFEKIFQLDDPDWLEKGSDVD